MQVSFGVCDCENENGCCEQRAAILVFCGLDGGSCNGFRSDMAKLGLCAIGVP